MSFASLCMVLITAAAGAQEQTSLKQLSARFRAGATPEERLAVLTEIALLPQDEKKPRKDIAAALARGLKDESIPLRGETVRLLMVGQHREVSLKAVIEALNSLRTDLGKLSTARARGNPNPGQKEVVERLEQLIRLGRSLCAALGRLPDDRAVDALADFSAKAPEEFRGRFAETVARSLTQLGTREAWKGAVALLPFLEGREGSKRGPVEDPALAGRKSALQRVHEVLVGAARALGHDDLPEGTAKASSRWRAWSSRHQRDFPAKLGRISPSAIGG